jgi:hypothetical protein
MRNSQLWQQEPFYFFHVLRHELLPSDCSTNELFLKHYQLTYPKVQHRSAYFRQCLTTNSHIITFRRYEKHFSCSFVSEIQWNLSPGRIHFEQMYFLMFHWKLRCGQTAHCLNPLGKTIKIIEIFTWMKYFLLQRAGLRGLSRVEIRMGKCNLTSN